MTKFVQLYLHTKREKTNDKEFEERLKDPGVYFVNPDHIIEIYGIGQIQGSDQAKGSQLYTELLLVSGHRIIVLGSSAVIKNQLEKESSKPPVSEN